MTLYVDGDAFPNLLKPILVRAIERLALRTFVISNKRITLGESKHITYTIVDAGADEADHRIAEMTEEGDLVITADIPLADPDHCKKSTCHRPPRRTFQHPQHKTVSGDAQSDGRDPQQRRDDQGACAFWTKRCS